MIEHVASTKELAEEYIRKHADTDFHRCERDWWAEKWLVDDYD